MDLIQHMYWADHRLLDAAETLDQEVFRTASGDTPRGLRATLCHAVDAQQVWRCALQGSTRDEFGDPHLRPDDYPDVATLRARWARDEAAMRTWLDTLSQDDLDRPVQTFQTTRPLPVGTTLLHVIVHDAHQQADAATLLTAAGASPGEIEYGDYLLGTDGWSDAVDPAG